MNLFGLGKVVGAEPPSPLRQELAELRDEVHKVQSELRQLEAEQINLHDQVRKWMRRAVAAERNQERAPDGAAPSLPAPPARLGLVQARRGARARIAARRAAEAAAVSEADGTEG